jgi:aldehyde dehydrogenase (NAD+)
MAENLELRREEFALRLSQLTGQSVEEGRKEVDLAVERLFYWGSYADKYGGEVQVSNVLLSFYFLLPLVVPIRKLHCMVLL